MYILRRLQTLRVAKIQRFQTNMTAKLVLITIYYRMIYFRRRIEQILMMLSRVDFLSTAMNSLFLRRSPKICIYLHSGQYQLVPKRKIQYIILVEKETKAKRVIIDKDEVYCLQNFFSAVPKRLECIFLRWESSQKSAFCCVVDGILQIALSHNPKRHNVFQSLTCLFTQF